MSVSSMAKRAGAAVLGGALAVSLLAGCGGSDDGDQTAEKDESTAAASDAPSSAAPTGYLPVPAGVTLTEPGATLRFGDRATVAWRPRQDRVVALDLAVTRIDETTFKESFEGWVVTAQMKRQTPYFVHATATNVSDADVGGLLVPLYALSNGTSLYEPLDFRDEPFEPCPGGALPAKLKPGKSTDLCFVYLLPQAQPLTAAAFDLVGELAPITWSGRITAVEKEKKDRKKGKQRG